MGKRMTRKFLRLRKPRLVDQVVPTEQITSVAIRRLVEEVRQADDPPPSSYNRVYSRHNRGA